jgi:hypothetical protein
MLKMQTPRSDATKPAWPNRTAFFCVNLFDRIGYEKVATRLIKFII